jgi:hypothetical protein
MELLGVKSLSSVAVEVEALVGMVVEEVLVVSFNIQIIPLKMELIQLQ